MLLDQPPAVERRITLRLLAYWEKLRNGREMPLESDLNPEDIADLWGQCFLIHVGRMEDTNYHYSYMGEGIEKAWDSGHTEGAARQLVSPNAGQLASVYKELLSSRKPLINEGEFRNGKGQVVRFRQCLLPLGKDGHVEAIFGGLRFKVFGAS